MWHCFMFAGLELGAWNFERGEGGQGVILHFAARYVVLCTVTLC